MNLSNGGMILIGGNRSTSSITNPICIDLASNSGLVRFLEMALPNV